MVEVGSLRKAVYDFSSDNDHELPLQVGDIVQILQWVDKQWSHGRCHGKEGNFPTSFTIDIQIPTLEENQRLFVPFTEFTAQQHGDLSFKKGDLVVGHRAIDNNWWEGECNGSLGIFPVTHVWKVDRSLLPNSAVPHKVYKKARVKMNMKAQLKQEMDLVKDEIVTITEEVDKGWYRGTCDGRSGIFPSSFVTILQADSDNIDNLLSCDTSAQNIEKPLVPEIVENTSDQYGYDCVNSGIASYGRSLYPFRSEYPNELSFHEGEIINLIRHIDDKWMEGEIDGRVGIFPTNFVNIIVDCPGAVPSGSDETVFPPDTYGRVLMDFQSQSEVKLLEGDTVTLLRQVNQHFYEIQTDKELTCACPVSYIEVIGNGPDLLPPSYSEVVGGDHALHYSLKNGNVPNISYSTTRAERPLSYPSTSFDHSNVDTNHRDFNFTFSQSINDKITQNIMSLDSTATAKTRSSPGLARRSYSLCNESNSSSDFASGRSHSPSPFVKQNQEGSMTYENIDSVHATSWSYDEPTSITSKVPLRPKPPVNRTTSLRRSSNNSENFGSLKETSLDGQNNVSDATNHKQEDEAAAAAQREIVAAQKRETEEKRRSEERKKKMKEQRSCVIMEILQTERDYKSDLQILYDSFVRDSSVSKAKGIDVETLFGNLDEVIDVACRLVGRLEKTSKAPDQNQTIGLCFVEMADDMKEVYGHYCRNHDDVNAVLDKYDERSQAGIYLRHKVEVMKRQTNCFDLPSMLIKPVQRILKYPLLLNELVKCTEDGHPDKQSLIEAIGLMTDVATAINEFKRRKDLVFKYRKHSDTSLSGRISKLSIHSMLKKSSRLGMRLSNSIGLRHVTKDESFAKLERQFHTLEKSIKIFIKDITVFMEKTEEQIKTAFRIAEDIADLYQERKTQQEVDQFRTVHRVIATQFWEANKQVLERNVIFILKQLLQTFHGPSNLIEKRYDKLLDYEACSNKLEKNKDVMKIKMLQDNLQIAKNNYEALNSQLLDDLPKLYETSIQILRDCICCFLKAKKNFIGKNAREMLGLTELPLLLSSQGAGALETFHVKHTLVTDNLSSTMSIVPKNLFPQSKPSTLKRNSSPALGYLSLGSSTQSKVQSKQSSGEQTKILSMYSPDLVYVACDKYDAVDILDLSLRKNDIVGIVKQQDPMGNRLRWFVDKGDSRGFVPAKVLKKREMSSTAHSSTVQQPTLQSQPSFGKSKVEAPKLPPPPSYSSISKSPHQNQPIINASSAPTKPNDAKQPVRPAPPVSLTNRQLSKGASDQPAVPPNVPNNNTAPDVADSTPHRYEEIDELLGHYDAVSQEVPTSSQSMVPSVSVEEFDPYGPVSSQAQLYDNVPNGKNDSDLYSGHRYEVIPESGNEESSGYFYAMFDFLPVGPNQLPVIKGQVVLVIHKCDLNRNSEWWFVEDRHGNKGYVPASYLQLYPLGS